MPNLRPAVGARVKYSIETPREGCFDLYEKMSPQQVSPGVARLQLEQHPIAGLEIDIALYF